MMRSCRMSSAFMRWFIVIAYLRILFIFQNHVMTEKSSTERDSTWVLPVVDKKKEHEVAFLIIAVDSHGSCPSVCTFAHKYLPPWAKYRYINFQDETDLGAAIENDKDSHLLLVARTNIVQLSLFANTRRERLNKSVALWHMADERVFAGEILDPYRNFDFVIRNYWRWKDDFDQKFGMKLRALGNHTCGDSPPLPVSNEIEPRFGVHWAFLGPHAGEHELLLHAASSVWPTSRRPVNCTFHGRKDVKRSEKTRNIMFTTMQKVIPELNCEMEFYGGFAIGGDDKWSYLVGELQNTKIGLSPGGSNVETHRLAESLQMGSVPAALDQPYMHAPFRDIPAILGSNWTEVAMEMKRLVLDELNGGKELETLSYLGTKFYSDLTQCMRSDVGIIFDLILAHYDNKSDGHG